MTPDDFNSAACVFCFISSRFSRELIQVFVVVPNFIIPTDGVESRLSRPHLDRQNPQATTPKDAAGFPHPSWRFARAWVASNADWRLGACGRARNHAGARSSRARKSPFAGPGKQDLASLADRGDEGGSDSPSHGSAFSGRTPTNTKPSSPLLWPSTLRLGRTGASTLRVWHCQNASRVIVSPSATPSPGGCRPK